MNIQSRAVSKQGFSFNIWFKSRRRASYVTHEAVSFGTDGNLSGFTPLAIEDQCKEERTIVLRGDTVQAETYRNTSLQVYR